MLWLESPTPEATEWQQQDPQLMLLKQTEDVFDSLKRQEGQFYKEAVALLQDDGPNRSDSGNNSVQELEVSLQGSLNLGIHIGHQFDLYAAVSRQCSSSLLCCFLLCLSTYVVYPIKVQRMTPCGSTNPALYQLLLVAAYHLGVIAGRCTYCCCCTLSFKLVPAVLLLRLMLLPLLYWFESLPRTAIVLLRIASTAFSSNLKLSHQQCLFMLDLFRWLALFLYAALHGHLSVVGAVRATLTPSTLPGREAAAFLMSLSETLGFAAGTALSFAVPTTSMPLEGWTQAAAATAPHLA
ncbi:hypothetical protein cyc_00441 [Cyclospora cayetanensis]|nr:hypothetical protein cyc_00441 [Cyclospora cayetanensis]